MAQRLLIGLLICLYARQGMCADNDPSTVTQGLSDFSAKLPGISMSWDENVNWIGKSPKTEHYKLLLGQMRLHYWMTGARGDTEVAYDGSHYDMYLSHKVLLRESASSPKRDGPMIDSAYLSLIGIYVPDTAGRMRDTVWPQSDVLRRLTNGKLISVKRIPGLLIIDIEIANEWKAKKPPPAEYEKGLRRTGVPEVEIPKYMETYFRFQKMPDVLRRTYVLRPDLNYCIAEITDRLAEGGSVIEKSVNSDFRKIPGKAIWLPFKSRQEKYTTFEPGTGGMISQQAQIEHDFSATATESQNDANDKFLLDVKPAGTLVIDETDPLHEKRYYIAQLPKKMSKFRLSMIFVNVFGIFVIAVAILRGYLRRILSRSRTAEASFFAE